MKRYTSTHEWLEIHECRAKVGLSTYARQELGDIVYLELPEITRQFAKGEEVLVLESTKAATDLYMPVSGKVTKINEALKDHLDWLNDDPEAKGWLYEIQVEDKQAFESLLDEASYQEICSSQA